MKRVVLFILANMAILTLLFVSMSIIEAVFGIKVGSYLGNNSYLSVFIFAALLGFGGSFISLAISKWMAKMATGAKVITHPSNETESWLLATIRRQAQQAGIGMPDVATYEASDLNAFATGMNRNSALVAVSTGLLENMTKDEVEAVLAHEVSHIANGDMVTMALLQGVLNTFVIFFARIIGYVVDKVVFKNEDGPGIGYFITSIVAEILLGILASIIVMWFSRQREFRADEGGAKLADSSKMIAALERLQQHYGEPSQLPSQMAAFGISSGPAWARIFMSHPPLEERIAALRN